MPFKVFLNALISVMSYVQLLLQ